MRTIKTCPGIGDSLWVIQKLINCGEAFDWQIHDGFPQRGKQIFDLLPQIANSCTYTPNLPYSAIDFNNIVRKFPQWKHIVAADLQDFYLSANRHLEEGNRIEQFLPDLPTSFLIDYATTPEDKARANSILFASKPAIGIYASAYSTQRSWGFWDAKGWQKFIHLLAQECPEAEFVIIGAKFDTDLGNNLIWELGNANIRFINTIGEPLSVVIEILKQLDYFIGFPSGLSILNETLDANGTFMFYPPHLRNVIETWADPARIATGQYKGALFCEPEKAFAWIRDEYKLFDRL